MPSTSFKMRCPECGRSINFEHYWKHITACAQKEYKKLQQRLQAPQEQART